jgi:hypothetical protein
MYIYGSTNVAERIRVRQRMQRGKQRMRQRIRASISCGLRKKPDKNIPVFTWRVQREHF